MFKKFREAVVYMLSVTRASFSEAGANAQGRHRTLGPAFAITKTGRRPWRRSRASRRT